jgi:hypothetical protein
LKKPLLLVAALSLMAFGGHAFADHHQSFSSLGPGAAHLAAAHAATSPSAEQFVLRQDPSGAPMCFDTAGAKASLSSCDGTAQEEAAVADHVVAFDPSGAPMCFDTAGSKAPLSACQPILAGLAWAQGQKLASR